MRIGRKVGKKSYFSTGKSGNYFSTKIGGWRISHFASKKKRVVDTPKKTRVKSSRAKGGLYPGVGWEPRGDEKISVPERDFKKIPLIDPDFVDLILLVLFYPLAVLASFYLGIWLGIGIVWSLFALGVYFYSPKEAGVWTYATPLAVFVNPGFFVWAVLSGLVVTIFVLV